MAKQYTPEWAETDPNVVELRARDVISIDESRITYRLNKSRSYSWTDPEEWVRACTIAFLINVKKYPAERLRTEHPVPRRVPSDFADVVVFLDDKCKAPYLVVENKPPGRSQSNRDQGIEQVFGNANSLRAPYALYDDALTSITFDLDNHPPQERIANRLGDRHSVPEQYDMPPIYTLIAGGANDILPVPDRELSNRIRRAHSVIWAGGRRDPLKAFDEWSKILFAKVIDERSTSTGDPRRFQVGGNETSVAVAARIHELFHEGARKDSSIFAPQTRIDLPDAKILEVVEAVQGISLTQTDIDTIGRAFENFFGSVFRGDLGQYFTMRPLARFIVSALDVDEADFVIDPTAGSGGFLLETLMAVWRGVDRRFSGQPEHEVRRIKVDFALRQVFGIEVHEILSRICKINLLLHHDGHTNIEGDRSCLDSVFSLPRLQNWSGQFTKVVGNPPFGDDIEDGDRDKLGENSLDSFAIATGRQKVPSEQVILERSVDLLEPGGTLGLIVPDGLLNNPGGQSNCPQTRSWLVRAGVIDAIISLPDHAFRHSGAQNKTSILLFRKFSADEARRFERHCQDAIGTGMEEDDAIMAAHDQEGNDLFLAEANQIGYSSTGITVRENDLYRTAESGSDSAESGGESSTILDEYRAFKEDRHGYQGRLRPDCCSIGFSDLWEAHKSHRLDPKYHLFKRQESSHIPGGWVTAKIKDVMRRRLEEVRPASRPDHEFNVMTISQVGEIRKREAGKGRNPPEWLGMYFEASSSKWYAAHAGDVVFSSIDLWKGCISVVPDEFYGALVTKEFPIYKVTDQRLSAEFLSALLRSRYYQRAFRAITTGHSNRRRTQTVDFENLEIAFPPNIAEQRHLIEPILSSRNALRVESSALRTAARDFDDFIDGRGDEELPEIVIEGSEEQDQG